MTNHRWLYVVVEGDSMTPTVRDGDVLLVDASTPPTRRAVVAWRPPAGAGLMIKRVVGLPGESVASREGGWTLGPDEYFLLGDRREDSLDSRRIGPAHRADLRGVVRCRIWPPRSR